MQDVTWPDVDLLLLGRHDALALADQEDLMKGMRVPLCAGSRRERDFLDAKLIVRAERLSADLTDEQVTGDRLSQGGIPTDVLHPPQRSRSGLN
jgi:hypothetical protein